VGVNTPPGLPDATDDVVARHFATSRIAITFTLVAPPRIAPRGSKPLPATCGTNTMIAPAPRPPSACRHGARSHGRRNARSPIMTSRVKPNAAAAATSATTANAASSPGLVNTNVCCP
jgi:hypothetical protein